MATWTQAITAMITKVDETIGKTFDDTNGYVEIPEAINPQEQWESYLRKGYAILFGPNSRIPGAQSVKTRVLEQRAFGILLTREITATTSDTSGRQAVSLDMIEDSEKLRAAFDADRYLGGTVTDIIWETDSGVVDFLDEEQKYYQLAIEVIVKLSFTS